MEKQYLLPASVLNALMQYLQEKPYKEVAPGIAALAQLREFTETKRVPEGK